MLFIILSHIHQYKHLRSSTHYIIHIKSMDSINKGQVSRRNTLHETSSRSCTHLSLVVDVDLDLEKRKETTNLMHEIAGGYKQQTRGDGG
ncbi:unnamed protein product [Brassica oleracea]